MPTQNTHRQFVSYAQVEALRCADMELLAQVAPNIRWGQSCAMHCDSFHQGPLCGQCLNPDLANISRVLESIKHLQGTCKKLRKKMFGWFPRKPTDFNSIAFNSYVSLPHVISCSKHVWNKNKHTSGYDNMFQTSNMYNININYSHYTSQTCNV